jgi:hypothetical protein
MNANDIWLKSGRFVRVRLLKFKNRVHNGEKRPANFARPFLRGIDVCSIPSCSALRLIRALLQDFSSGHFFGSPRSSIRFNSVVICGSHNAARRRFFGGSPRIKNPSCQGAVREREKAGIIGKMAEIRKKLEPPRTQRNGETTDESTNDSKSMDSLCVAL